MGERSLSDNRTGVAVVATTPLSCPSHASLTGLAGAGNCCDTLASMRRDLQLVVNLVLLTMLLAAGAAWLLIRLL